MFDLFAGCGGLSTGLEFEGFTPALVSELHTMEIESSPGIIVRGIKKELFQTQILAIFLQLLKSKKI